MARIKFNTHRFQWVRTLALRCVVLQRYVRQQKYTFLNTLNPELNPICYLLALLGAHLFLHISRIRVKLLTLRRLMPYTYIYIYIYIKDISSLKVNNLTLILLT